MQSNIPCEASSAAAIVVLPGWPRSAPRMTPGGHKGEQQGVLLALLSGVGATAALQPGISWKFFTGSCKTQGNAA